MIPKPKSTIIIDSQSDIESSSSDHSKQMEQEYNNMSLNNEPRQDLYQKFHNSTYFLITDSLKKYAEQITVFLQSNQRRVLFIFGPSGCGKGTLVKKVLDHSEILYKILAQEQDIEEGKTISLEDIILDNMSNIDSFRVYLSYDFPITLNDYNSSEIRQFKKKFLNKIKTTITKTIFILNEEIYNSFYVLNQRSTDPQENLANRKNVSVIKMESYGVIQMKKLLKEFYDHQKLYEYVGLGKDLLDEIVQLANGDARKALNLLYLKGVENKAVVIRSQELKRIQKYHLQKKQKQPFVNEKPSFKGQSKTTFIQEDEESHHNSHAVSLNSSLSSMQMYTNSAPVKRKPKSTRPDYSKFLKYKSQDESRCTLFHGLGKLLYGKRLNVKHIPKNKKEVSCYYSQKQINELDPPFYFDPVLLYEHMRVDFNTVVNLLQENYLDRYGKIKDVQKMSKIFCLDDGFFNYLDIVQNEDVKELKAILITWGILLYNKNSRIDNKGFKPISKSQITNIDKKIKEKKRLLKVYFPENKIDDLLKIAHLTRNKMSNSLLNQTIFNQTISSSFQTRVDQHTKVVKDDDEEMQTIMKLSSNEIEKKLKDNREKMEQKKLDMAAVFAEMQDEDSNKDSISSDSEPDEK